jgi:hypothetical protein
LGASAVACLDVEFIWSYDIYEMDKVL